MTAWKRWQDYATMAFGVLLIISPIVLGDTSHHLSSYGAYGLGALLVLGGIGAAANREPRRSLLANAPGIAAVITLVGGIVLLFGSAPAIGWAAAAFAILTVLIAATSTMAGRKA